MDPSSAVAEHRRARLGDFTHAQQAIDALEQLPAGHERDWALPLRALVAMTLPDAGPLPSPADVSACEDATAAAHAGRQGVLAAVLAPDPDALGAWIDALDVVSSRRGGALAVAGAALARSWQQVLRGEPASHVEPALVRDASHDEPGIAIEVKVVEALDALSRDEVADATRAARQASRMAAAEGLLQHEYLANLVLGGVRRRGGRGYLAVRILRALARVVPQPWRAWIDWELAMAGDVPENNRLHDAVAAAAAGDRAALAAAVEREWRAVAGFAALADDVHAWAAMLDPSAPPDDVVHAWATGGTTTAPRGIVDPGDDPMVVALVAGGPRMVARRFLRAGAGLVPAPRWEAETSARGRRSHDVIAALLLAGAEGIDARALFRATYGFPMEDAGHEEILRGLVHRIRGELGDAAEVARDGERIVLHPARVLVVPDSRCERSTGERVLRFLAVRQGRATAKEVASALRIPLRTVQRTLGQLVEDGACAAEPDGRRTEYVVEDTTFHEPTLHRLRGRGTIPPPA